MRFYLGVMKGVSHDQIGLILLAKSCAVFRGVQDETRVERALFNEKKEQERERNHNSSTLFNPVFPNISDLGT